MKQTHLTLTFIKTLRVSDLIFEQGESVTVLYHLGGGDLLRCEYEGVRYEIPSSVVRQETLCIPE